MPKLPDKQATFGDVQAPNISGYGTAPRYTGGEAIGRSVARLGANLGAVVQTVGEEIEKQEGFVAAKKYADFQFAVDQDYRDRVENMQPGAPGFTQSFVNNYDRVGVDFLKSFPASQQREYAVRLSQTKRQYAASADSVELKEKDRYGVASVKDAANKILLGLQVDPTRYASASGAINSLVDGVPVTNVTRDNLRREFDGAVSRAAIDGILANGGGAEEVRKFVTSTSPKNEAPSSGGPLAAEKQAIAGIESGGDYSKLGPVVLKTGDRAYGKYQVMGANIPSWTRDALNKEMTPQQFLADEKAQEAVFEHRFGGYVKKYGREGAARAWFAGEGKDGKGGMHNQNAKDSLGTSVARYSEKFLKGLAKHGGGTGDIDTTISDYAEHKIRKYEAESAGNKAITGKLMKDYIVSLYSTGQGVPGVTDERVKKAYGDEGLISFTNQKAYAAQYYQAAKEIDDLPNRYIRERVEAAKPAPGTPGYADNLSLYEKLAEHAEKVVKSREKDPAASVNDTPVVQDALKTGDMAKIAEARITAQYSLGFPEGLQSPITNTEARDYASGVKRALPGQEQEAVTKLIKKLHSDFGPHAENALKHIMRQSKFDKEEAGLSVDAMDDLKDSGIKGITPKSVGRGNSAKPLPTGPMTDVMDPVMGTVTSVPTSKVKDSGGTPVKPSDRPALPNTEAVRALRNNPTPKVIAAFEKEFPGWKASEFLPKRPLKPGANN